MLNSWEEELLLKYNGSVSCKEELKQLSSEKVVSISSTSTMSFDYLLSQFKILVSVGDINL